MLNNQADRTQHWWRYFFSSDSPSSRTYRGVYVYYGNSSVTRGHITIDIGHRHGKRVVTDITTAEHGRCRGGYYKAIVKRTTVDLTASDRSRTSRVKLNCDILAYSRLFSRGGAVGRARRRGRY